MKMAKLYTGHSQYQSSSGAILEGYWSFSLLPGNSLAKQPSTKFLLDVCPLPYSYATDNWVNGMCNLDSTVG